MVWLVPLEVLAQPLALLGLFLAVVVETILEKFADDFNQLL